ncbi:Alkaline nuclease [Operophtera brumata]|uniref:Alkaline nuclease n=2 Tax=Operophtera brumata TaxID=104452 RepID=A0A0L7KYC4_OPEBR|nr:Alkaline nuclease [Operophtera brumata]
MEQGFTKANSSNLPRVDLLTLGEFLASNKDFCSAEFRNVKTTISSRPSYGDDAVSYVQLKRDGNLCIMKAKICPEHKVHAKLYGVTLIIDEVDEAVKSVECHDCVASQGGCKHAIAFLMWVHRRSEDPSCTSVECYWMKSKLSRVGNTLKYITSIDLSNGKPSLPSNSGVFEKFLEEGKKRKLNDCELLKYQKDYVCDTLERLSMHKLVLKYKEKSCDTFLKKIVLTDGDVIKVEEETRDQHQSYLWHEIRYGRVTASRAYEFSRCKTSDGTLIALIMGGKLPDTSAMKRGRMLEDKVRKTVSTRLGKKIQKCGLMLCKKYPMLAGSPDGICEANVIEIKCPISEKTLKNYVQNGKPTQKFYVQMQLQMYLTGLHKGYFCVADCNYSVNKNVDIISVTFDDKYVSDFIKVLVSSWKDNVYPLLYQSVF